MTLPITKTFIGRLKTSTLTHQISLVKNYGHLEATAYVSRCALVIRYHWRENVSDIIDITDIVGKMAEPTCKLCRELMKI